MSKYINYKLILLLIALPIVLVIVFPSPYFESWYDYEPDYFANLLSVLLNNHPVDYIHPGLTVTYLSAILIQIVGFFESQEALILSLRFFFLFLNLIIIYLSMSFLNKNNTEQILLFIAILILYPAGHYYLDILSPHVILSSLGVLIAILGIKLNENTIRYPLAYGLVLALGVATKFPFILVTIPVIFSIFFGFLKGEKKHFKVSFLIIMVSFICSSLILFYPILPMMPLYPTIWPDVISFIKSFLGIQEIYKTSFYFFALIVLISFIARKMIIILKKKINYDYTYESVYRVLSLVCLFYVFIVPIIDIISGKSYMEIAKWGGNFLPILGFLVLFLTYNFSIFKLSVIKYYIVCILLLAVSLKAYTNFNNYSESIITANNFSSNTQSLLEGDNDVVFYPSSKFISKEYFFIWSDYRYGDSASTFHDRRKSIPFRIDSKLERIHILNNRNFYIPEDYFSGKFSYRYMKKLLKSNYTPDLYKSLLGIHLYRLDKKDICTQPYDGFSTGRNFIVIIPEGLQFRNIGITKDASANAHTIASNLIDSWTNRCNYKVDYSVDNFANIKSIFLKVQTAHNE
jgi:hypothetical protein